MKRHRTTSETKTELDCLIHAQLKLIDNKHTIHETLTRTLAFLGGDALTKNLCRIIAEYDIRASCSLEDHDDYRLVEIGQHLRILSSEHYLVSILSDKVMIVRLVDRAVHSVALPFPIVDKFNILCLCFHANDQFVVLACVQSHPESTVLLIDPKTGTIVHTTVISDVYWIVDVGDEMSRNDHHLLCMGPQTCKRVSISGKDTFMQCVWEGENVLYKNGQFHDVAKNGKEAAILVHHKDKMEWWRGIGPFSLVTRFDAKYDLEYHIVCFDLPGFGSNDQPFLLLDPEGWILRWSTPNTLLLRANYLKGERCSWCSCIVSVRDDGNVGFDDEILHN